MAHTDDPWVEGAVDLNRLIYLSDGVFAIAVTLSALQIPVPASAADLTGQLVRLLPNIGIYAFSFVVIAAMWMTHHRMFHFINRGDARLFALNLGALLVIAFMPFPVALVGRHGDQRVAVVAYAASMAVAGAALTMIWVYATHERRLVERDLDGSIVRYVGLRITTVSALFALSIPLAFLPHGPTITSWFWVGIFVVRRFLFRFYSPSEHDAGVVGDT